MNNSFMQAGVEFGFDINLIAQLSHPPFLAEAVELGTKDRASRLKRRFDGTRHHAWLDALSRSMGFQGWSALSEATTALMNKAWPADGRYDPQLIPPEFAGTLVLLAAPGPEARPPDVMIQQLYAFSEKLALQSGQQRDELLDCIASWWGSASWSEFAVRKPSLAKKPFYEFEVTDEFDASFDEEVDILSDDFLDPDVEFEPHLSEPHEAGQWRLSTACQQVAENVAERTARFRKADVDPAPFLREVFDGRDGEQPLLQAGLTLAQLRLEGGHNGDALAVLTELDQRCSALMPDGFEGSIHYLIPENEWYLAARYLLMVALIETGDIASALRVAQRNTVFDSRSERWNSAWLSMLFLMQGDSASAVHTIKRGFDLDDIAIPEAYLPFIVAALVHGEYEDAAYRFASLVQQQPDAIGSFVACFNSDDPEEDIDLIEANSDVEDFLLTDVLPTYPKVREVLAAWDHVLNEREDDPALPLLTQLKSAPAGTGERYDLLMRVEATKITTAEQWRSPLADIARTILTSS